MDKINNEVIRDLFRKIGFTDGEIDLLMRDEELVAQIKDLYRND